MQHAKCDVKTTFVVVYPVLFSRKDSTGRTRETPVVILHTLILIDDVGNDGNMLVMMTMMMVSSTRRRLLRHGKYDVHTVLVIVKIENGQVRLE